MSSSPVASIIRSATKSTISTTQSLNAAAGSPLPGLEATASLLGGVIALCERVPQNRYAAQQLANGCSDMYRLLEQYQRTDLPDRALQYREGVFDCLKYVELKMTTWSKAKWYKMLIHQDECANDINECNERVRSCLDILMAGTNLETLAFQKTSERWRREFMESIDKDYIELKKSLASAGFVQKAVESNVTENRNDIRKLLELMQKHFSKETTRKDDRERMASNLYDLLHLSHQLLPRLLLDSGEVEWTNDSPLHHWKNVTIYRGRYLKREDVMIKVIRSVKKDEKNIDRIRREVETWAKMYEVDQGKHIIPFYGFCTSDGIHLAMVSPWIEHGDALTYVKHHDRMVNYRNLIRGIAEGIVVLHSMDEPVVHGQLRAEKILIGDSGQPLLTDFALSKLEGNDLTQTAGISDAYRWCAPEVTMETSVASSKSDIYSFGMTILELLTHEKPYATISKSIQVIREMEKGVPPEQPRDARVIERGLDDNTWGLLLLCWSFQPELRPSINELLARL